MSSSKLTAGSTIKLSCGTIVKIPTVSQFSKVMEEEERPCGGYSKLVSSSDRNKNGAGEQKKKQTKCRAFSKEEDEAILKHYEELGAKWKAIKRAEPTLFQERSSDTLSGRYRNLMEKKKKKKKDEKKVTGATKAKGRATSNSKKKNGNGKKRKRSAAEESDSEVEIDSDLDVDSDFIVAKTSSKDRANRAKKRQERQKYKENLQNMTEKLM